MSIKPDSFLTKSYYKLISYDKVRFIIVGTAGFVVNYASLALFFDLLNFPILMAQIVGAELALLSTFVGNNFWAFTHHHHISLKHKLVKFHASAVAGLLINSTFVVILVHYAHMYYGLALVIGSAAGLVWNYTLYKRFVFNPHSQDKSPETNSVALMFYNLVKVLPFVVPAAVSGFSIPIILLLLTGQFKTFLVFPLGLAGAVIAALIAGFHTAALKLPGSLKEQRYVGAAVIILLLAWMGFNAKYSSQEIVVHRDPAIYADAGEWLKTHDSLDIKSSQVFGDDPNILPDTAGFGSLPEQPGRLYVQGQHLLPTVLGVAARLGGTVFMLRTNAILGGLALLTFYGLVRCFVRPRWALLATSALAVSLPMIFLSRSTYSEPLDLLLATGTLALIWAAQTKSSMKIWLLAGLAAGTCTVNRADSYLVIAALAIFIFARLGFASRKRRSQVAKESLWFALGTGFTTLLGWLDLTTLSALYYHDLRQQLVEEFLLLGLIVVVGIVGLVIAWKTELFQKLILKTRKLHRPAIIAAAILLSLFFLSRPLWFTGHSAQPNSLVASLQAGTGHKVESTRDYAEMTAYWIIWYIGPIMALSAVLGMTMSAMNLAGKRPNVRLLAPLIVLTITAVLYMYNPNISPDQVWASRRFMPVTFPLLCLFAVIALESGWQRYVTRLKPAVKYVAAAALALLILLPSIYLLQPSLFVKTYASQLTQIDSVCAALPDHSAVLLVGNGAFSSTQTIRTFCDVPAMRIVTPTAQDLHTAADAASKEGLTPIVLAFDNNKQTLPGSSQLSLVSSITYKELSRNLYHPPHGLDQLPSSIWVGRLQPDGSLRPL